MNKTPSPHDAGTLQLKRARSFVFDRLELSVLEGPDQGKSMLSSTPELLIGSAEGCDLRLSDESVSRHHCAVQSTPKGLFVKDLESTNGTRLNGIRIEAAYIDGTVTLGLGNSLLRCRRLEEPAHESLGKEDRCERLLGTSPLMRRMFGRIRRIAASDCPVLIEGETGTGKGLVAETLHALGLRSKGPFVVLDCAAVAPSLLESELFGHVKGAFTGAWTTRRGVLESAKGGTVFLDEIGELPLHLQPKLLRALEEQVIRPVGSVDAISLDVRILAATNRDLRKEVNRESFRADLFFRLNVAHITVPPLRDRREDIPMLVAHYYEQLIGSHGDPRPPLELLEACIRRDWPGNVRELRNAVQRAIVLDENPREEAAYGNADLAPPAEPAPPGPWDRSAPSFREAKEKAMAQWEKDYLEGLMRACGGNISGASREARMDRHHLKDLLKRYGVKAQRS